MMHYGMMKRRTATRCNSGGAWREVSRQTDRGGNIFIYWRTWRWVSQSRRALMWAWQPRRSEAAGFFSSAAEAPERSPSRHFRPATVAAARRRRIRRSRIRASENLADCTLETIARKRGAAPVAPSEKQKKKKGRKKKNNDSKQKQLHCTAVALQARLLEERLVWGKWNI